MAKHEQRKRSSASGYFVDGFQESGAALGARRCFAGVRETNLDLRCVNGVGRGNDAS